CAPLSARPLPPLHSFPTRRSSDLAHQGGRYWERLGSAPLTGLNKWHVPHGLIAAFQEMAMIAMRHRIECGTTDEQYAEVAVAFRSEEYTSELQSRSDLVCRLLLEK